MRLTKDERAMLNEMIETHTFYGIPLEEVTVDILEDIDPEDSRILYIVACMVGCEMRDKESFDHFPYDAEAYLSKFRLKKS